MFKGNAITWFEIPATDLDRAQKFYETIFGFEFPAWDMEGMRMRMFATENNSLVGGALIEAGDFNQPSATGTMAYLNAHPNLQTVLDKVEAAGGSIVMPKTLITPEIGFMAVFLDTEGNRIGLHSQE